MKTKLSEQEIKLIRQDLELYMSGKIKLTQIALKRKVAYQSVMKVQNQMMMEILNLNK